MAEHPKYMCFGKSHNRIRNGMARLISLISRIKPRLIPNWYVRPTQCIETVEFEWQSLTYTVHWYFALCPTWRCAFGCIVATHIAGFLKQLSISEMEWYLALQFYDMCT